MTITLKKNEKELMNESELIAQELSKLTGLPISIPQLIKRYWKAGIQEDSARIGRGLKLI